MNQLQNLNGTVMITIPESLLIDDLLVNLEVGHGYTWTRLVAKPKLWIHGNPPAGDLPEILIIGKRILIDGGDVYATQFRRMLHALARRGKMMEV